MRENRLSGSMKGRREAAVGTDNCGRFNPKRPRPPTLLGIANLSGLGKLVIRLSCREFDCLGGSTNAGNVKSSLRRQKAMQGRPSPTFAGQLRRAGLGCHHFGLAPWRSRTLQIYWLRMGARFKVGA